VKRILLLVVSLTVLGSMLLSDHPRAAQPARGWMRVPGEATWRKAEAAPNRWRAAQLPSSAVSRLTFRELPLKRIQEMQERNRRDVLKPTQVGVARSTAADALQRALPRLQWTATVDGAVARIEVRSPGAAGLRVGLLLGSVDDRVELRFAGSDDPSRVVAAVTGRQALGLASPDRLYWTPSTDGEAQIIEIYVPAGVSVQNIRIEAPLISHLVATARTGFKMTKSVGDSGSCNVDTACRVATLGTNFVKAKDSVALMMFVKEAGTYLCTGSLLADTVSTTQIPYFYSAHHCVSNQTVASTLETVWKFEATSCNSGVSGTTASLTGGATYLYSNEDTDALLLRLNQLPPTGTTFSGWDSAPLSMPANVTAIHHPMGDLKKVSLGQQTASSQYEIEVAWTSGTTEGGSSGSGLFTSNASGYFLRGGLMGGSAACANSGSVSNPDNRDYYSRFDVAFPSIKQYLAPNTVVSFVKHDFNGDGKSDVFWRNTSTGGNDIWLAAKSITRQATASVTNFAWLAVGSGDFTGDGKADMLWRNSTTGANELWRSGTSSQRLVLATEPNTAWKVAGIGDFNGDGKDDLFWRNASTGANGLWWAANRTGAQAAAVVGDQNWQVAGVGDFNADGKDDLLWRNNVTGANAIWRSGTSDQYQTVTAVTSLAWKIRGVGDFNGDGKADIFWRNTTTGANTIWLSASNATQQATATVSDLNWKVSAIGDYDADHRADVLWRHMGTGNNDVWRSGNSTTHILPARVADLNWKIVP
jgi:lysyl endopeptidase